MAEEVGTEFEIPKYPAIKPPKITYGMVHKLDCVQESKSALPLIGVPHQEDIEKAQAYAMAQAGIRRQMQVEAARDAVGITADCINVKDKILESEPESVKAAETIYIWNKPRLMILFDCGDINSALHYLGNSLHDPFAQDAIVTVLVQESILEQFLSRLPHHLHLLDPEVASHPCYVNTLAKLRALNANMLVGEVPAGSSPILVFDFTHKYLGKGPTGVVTMHTFRTAKEATQVYLQEKLKFSSVTIWNENLASAYEIVALIDCNTFLINCFNVDLEPIQSQFDAKKSDVKIVKGYHYETLTIKQKRKIIVFPVGNIFAN